jgi:hypothetical protein
MFERMMEMPFGIGCTEGAPTVGESVPAGGGGPAAQPAAAPAAGSAAPNIHLLNSAGDYDVTGESRGPSAEATGPRGADGQGAAAAAPLAEPDYAAGVELGDLFPSAAAPPARVESREPRVETTPAGPATPAAAGAEPGIWDEYLNAMLPLEGATEAELPALMEARTKAAAALDAGLGKWIEGRAKAIQSDFEQRQAEETRETQAQNVVLARANLIGNALRDNVYRLAPELAPFRDTVEEEELLLPTSQNVMRQFLIQRARAQGRQAQSLTAEIAGLDDKAFRQLTALVTKTVRAYGAPIVEGFKASGRAFRPLAAPNAEGGRVVSTTVAGPGANPGTGFKETPGAPRVAGVGPKPTDPALAEYDKFEAPLYRERDLKRRGL